MPACCVRPALDMKDPKQAALVRPVSDAVAELTQRHGGLLWGEHGKGVRSEYAPAFFGELYPSLQQLKAAFDPHNQFNPGKIATPPENTMRLLRIDEVPTRGDRPADRRARMAELRHRDALQRQRRVLQLRSGRCDVPVVEGDARTRAIAEGAGVADARMVAPAGQAGVDVVAAARARQPFLGGLPRAGATAARRATAKPISRTRCTTRWPGASRASCAGQCPVKVNVPEFRSRFLELYHQRYLRPLRA